MTETRCLLLQVNRYLRFNPDLSSSARLTLLALAGYANDEAECFPSRPKLSEWTGLSISTVRRALIELRGAGVIDWCPGGPRSANGDKGVNMANAYQITIPPRRFMVNLPWVHGEPTVGSW